MIEHLKTLMIYNANILSFQEGFVQGKADTVLIEKGRFKAIGKKEELEQLICPQTVLIDAAGKTLMPGLNDSHIHIWKVGNLRTFMLDVRAAKSLDEMLSTIQAYHQQYPDVAWITARGFNEAAWKEGRMPNKNDLDKVVKDKPVYVIRTCAHIAVANSKALEICKVGKDSVVPEGGVMYTDNNGNPNGLFSETALGLISNHLPAYTKEELKIMVRSAREQLYRLGITAATDPAVDPLLLQAYHEMNQTGELGFRLHAMPIILPDGGNTPFPVPDSYTSEFFNINTVKFFSDGGLSGKTSALKRYYKGTKEQGVLRLKAAQYAQLCTTAMSKGLGIGTHAIGDAAIEFVIDQYKGLRQQFTGIPLRVEHLGLPETKNLEDMVNYHIAASMQTIFLSELGKNFIRYLDQDYLDRCYPVKSVLQHGILTALSSDAPVVKDLNPFKGMEAAVTRKDNEGNSIAPQEAISIQEALKAYTCSAAAISGASEIGSVAVGKHADFILLNQNPLETAPYKLTSIQVEETFVNGNSVWKK
jgi:predicted amidohydrolase YtcJ